MVPQLADEYLVTRPNKDISHPKLAIFFLACSGSGKSTIRQLLVNKLQATYFCNDEARELLAMHGQVLSPKVVIDATWELWRIHAANQFIVFDSNMSAYYMHEDSYYCAAIRNRYQTYVIAIDLSEHELKARIKARNRYDKDALLELLPAQLEAYHLAIKVLKSDYILTSRTTDYGELIDSIRNKLS